MTVSQQFAVHVERRGEVRCLHPVGDLDVVAVGLLAREFEAAERSHAALIVIDLGRLSFIDSAGIALLVAMDCACVGEQRLRLIAAQPVVDRVLELAGVRARLPIVLRPPTPASREMPTRPRRGRGG